MWMRFMVIDELVFPAVIRSSQALVKSSVPDLRKNEKSNIEIFEHG